MLARTHVDTPTFERTVKHLVERGEADFSRVEGPVREILAHVRAEGDAAVLGYVERFEKRRPAALFQRDYGGEAALGRLPSAAREALRTAADSIRQFHARERQTLTGFSLDDGDGSVGLRLRALRKVGVYAPGGKARYPSSVLMSAIPAAVAGVKEILLATPLAEGPDGAAGNDALLAAAYLSGVTAVIDAGGAQAIGALAYGTASVPRVDKIVGPGNAYVACAKRLVYGAVAIDSIAGPSEILVVADGSASPAVVAADLLSQAEHDEDAYPLLICATDAFADAVDLELSRQLETLPRATIARSALRAHGHALVVPDRNRMAATADAIGPEHLSLQVEDPEGMAGEITCAGAIFLGHLTPEAAGDYLAGPSHVLPTGGAVRFASPLGVHDFFARTSLIRYGAASLARDSSAICALARLEGLEAHARAVTVRVDHVVFGPPPCANHESRS